METESTRQIALHIVSRLHEAGFAAWLVGGCVRDQLLGREPKDYDVATSARPEHVLALFPHGELVGASFGVVLIKGKVEVATFRSEMDYTDGRRPDTVTYETDVRLDAARRDFTINALYLDPLSHQLLDLVGGEQDLKHGIIRAIGDAHHRFREDHLRLLRAIRFAARFGFTIEPATMSALIELAPLIRRIAGERIHDEMRRIITGPHRPQAWQLLDASGLWRMLAPEAPAGHHFAALSGPVDVALGWAALLYGTPDPRPLFHRYRFSASESRTCLELLSDAPLVTSLLTAPLAAQKRFARRDTFLQHLALHHAIHGATPAWDYWQTRLWSAADLFPTPLITGDDLIALGHQPGPRFRAILDQVEDAQLEGRIHTRDEALALA